MTGDRDRAILNGKILRTINLGVSSSYLGAFKVIASEGPVNTGVESS